MEAEGNPEVSINSREINIGASGGIRENTTVYKDCTCNSETRKNPSPHARYAKEKIGNSMHGNMYQLKLLMLVFQRAVAKKYIFRLGTEIKEAADFDDLVFEYTQNNRKFFHLLQAKHKLPENRKKIKKIDLLDTKSGDYSLIKYFLSYDKCKMNALFKDGTIVNVTVCTNIKFDQDNLKSANIEIETIETSDDLLHMQSTVKESARYRFAKGIAPLLQKQLAIFEPSAKHSLDDIHDFLDHLVLAVNQPNEHELGIIIKEEIQKEFDGENVYHKFFELMLDWFQGKKGGGRFLTDKDGEEFFDEAKRGIPILFDIRPLVNSFTGRSKEVADLHHMLQDDSEVPHIACICGLGGVGKSELARKYITVYSENYDNRILWINAESYESLAASFRRLASDKLSINTKNISGQEKEIRSIVEDVYIFFAKGKSLFVFDNTERYKSQKGFDGLKDFLPSLPSGGNMLHILITSQNKKWPRHFKVLVLSVFNESEATDFLKNSLEINNNESMPEIKNLAELLDFLPLALQQAVSYINMHDEKMKNVGLQFTIQNYIHAYEEKTKECFNFSFYDHCDTSYTRTVLTTWNITLETLRQLEHGNNALKILNIASYLAPENIPTHFFSVLLTDPEQLGAAISLLSQYSLINVEKAKFNIHRLVQEVIRIKIQVSNRERQVLRSASKLFSRDSVNLNTLPHTVSFWNYLQKYDDLVIEFAGISGWISCALLENDRMKEAYVFGQNTLKKMIELSGGDDNIIVVTTKQNIGMALLKLAKYDMALEILREALEIGLKLGLPHLFILPLKNIIAMTLFSQAKSKEALKYFKEVCSYESTLGPHYHEIVYAKRGIVQVLAYQGEYAKSLHKFEEIRCIEGAIIEDRSLDALDSKLCYTQLLQQQDKFDEALKMYLEMYDISVMTLGKNHCTTLCTVYLMGALYARKKDFTKALQCYNEVINAEETIVKYHPLPLVARAKIADVWRMQGNYEQALELCWESFNKLTNNCNSHHHYTIETQYILASIYKTQGDYNKALEIYEEGLCKCKLNFNDNHPAVLDYTMAITVVLVKQNKVEKALQCTQRVLGIQARTFGENHLRTLGTKIYIGELLLKLNNHDKALQVLQDTFDVMKKVYPNHHMTLEVKEKIGFVFFTQSKLDNALRIFGEVIHSRKALFGEEHIETIQTKGNIANVLFKQGKTAQALELYREMHTVYTEVFGPQSSLTLDVNTSIQTVMRLNNDLRIAVRKDNLADTLQCVISGGDVNSINDDGWSLLHYAVSNANLYIVRFLIENGASIMQVTRKGNTPLHIAVSKGLPDIVDVLLQHTKPNELSDFVDARTTASGSSTLHVAARNGSLDIVKCLLKYGATYNIQDKENNTPLVLSRNQSIIQLLQLTEELFQDAKNGNINITHKLRQLSYDSLLAVSYARHQSRTILQIIIANNQKNCARAVAEMLQEARDRFPRR